MINIQFHSRIILDVFNSVIKNDKYVIKIWHFQDILS